MPHRSDYLSKRALHKELTRYANNPNPTDKAVLMSHMEISFGDLEVEFFDREGCLPLIDKVESFRVPWPLRIKEAERVGWVIAITSCVVMLPVWFAFVYYGMAFLGSIMLSWSANAGAGDVVHTILTYALAALVLMTSLGVAALVGAGCQIGMWRIVSVGMRLFPPANVAERRRLARVYDDVIREKASD